VPILERARSLPGRGCAHEPPPDPETVRSGLRAILDDEWEQHRSAGRESDATTPPTDLRRCGGLGFRPEHAACDTASIKLTDIDEAVRIAVDSSAK
jgi:hypothetical protein